MDEPFNALFDFDEGAIRHQVCYFAVHLGSDREPFLDFVPRITLGLLQAEGDTLLLLVDIQHHDIDFLADLKQLTWVSKPSPGHVGDVQKTIHPVQIDEGAEIGEILYCALYRVADLYRFQEPASFLGTFLLDDFPAAQHHVLPLVVDLNDLEIVGVADELLKITRRNNIDLRSGQERFDADVYR